MSQLDEAEQACSAAGIRVLKSTPGETLKIKCETHWAAKVLLAVFSLMFFAVGTQIVSGMLEFLGDWVRPVCALVGLTLWAWLSFRGVWITFDFKSKSYQLRTVVEAGYQAGWPEMKIISHEKNGVWEAQLECDGQTIGKPQRHADRRSAEAPLLAFTSIFTSPEDAVERLKRNALVQREALSSGSLENEVLDNYVTETEDFNFQKPPVVYLIHGTFAPDAAWTKPKSSELVEFLWEDGVVADFRRFRWSGRNRAADRMEGGKRLAEEIGPILDNQDQAVILVGHSHGGNVALQAGRNLTALQHLGLRYCFLATPFLSSNRRFDTWSYYDRLPEAIKDNILIAVQAAALLLTFLFYISIQNLFLPDELQVRFDRSNSGWLLFPAVLWLFGVPWLTLRASEAFLAATDPSDVEQKDAPNLSGDNALVCAYSNDEAYMALSALSNLMSFVQIGIFKSADILTAFLRRTYVFELLWGGAWLLLWFGMVFGFFFGGVLFFLGLLFGPQSMPEIKSLIGNLIPDRNSFPLGFLILVMLAALLAVGLLALGVIAVLLVFGLIRFLLFWFAGVADQVITRRDAINTLLGSVSISVVPFGDVRVHYIPGNHSFNHTEIYRDPDCHTRIAELIREVGEKPEAGQPLR